MENNKNDDSGLNDLIESVYKAKEDVKNAVKDKIEDPLNQAELALFEDITHTVIGVLTNEATQEVYAQLEKKIGNNITNELVQLISTTVTYAIFNAIAKQSNIVEELLNENFNNIKNDMDDIKARLVVNTVKINSFEKDKMLSELSKDIN